MAPAPSEMSARIFVRRRIKPLPTHERSCVAESTSWICNIFNSVPIRFEAYTVVDHTYRGVIHSMLMKWGCIHTVPLFLNLYLYTPKLRRILSTSNILPILSTQRYHLCPVQWQTIHHGQTETICSPMWFDRWTILQNQPLALRMFHFQGCFGGRKCLAIADISLSCLLMILLAMHDFASGANARGLDCRLGRGKKDKPRDSGTQHATPNASRELSQVTAAHGMFVQLHWIMNNLDGYIQSAGYP